jgi:hypothetical protein
MNKRIRNLAVFCSVLALAFAATAGQALAVYEPQDYDAVKTGALAEIGAALTSAWPIIALVIGVTVGVRIIRRFAK